MIDSGSIIIHVVDYRVLIRMDNPPVSCLPTNVKMSKAKKVLDDAREIQNPELDLCDKGIVTFEELPGLFNMRNVTRLTLSHNKIRSVPPNIADLVNLEILNLFNNHLEELPISISSLPKLRILNLGMNRLDTLPRGFGACPALEVLDLTYNNLNENSLPKNFFMLETLRALYLGDNDFEVLSPEIGKMKNLQILVLRDNDLIEIPKEIGELTRLRELHLQANRLTLLPPELGNLDFTSEKSELKLHLNDWVAPINDQLQGGTYKIMEYLRSETYRFLYNRQKSLKSLPPPKMVDKSKKLSRLRQQS